MERTEILKKLSEFMNEVLYGELKSFKLSTKDLIELYCEVRRQEDELTEKAIVMVKTPLVETRLRNFKPLRKILVETYAAITKEEAALAKLERWYGRSKCVQKQSVSPAPKVRVMNSDQVMPVNKVAQLKGMPKSKAFLDINAILGKEGFWKGRLEKTSLAEDELRYFYYVLRLDEYFLTLLNNNRYVYINVNDRLYSLVKSRGSFTELFKKQFGLDIETDFLCWQKAIGAVFPQAEKLAHAVETARTEQAVIEAYGKLVKFWNAFGFVRKQNSESERILNLTMEILPAEYGFITTDQHPVVMQLLERLPAEQEEQKANDIRMIREIVKTHNCRSVAVNAKDYNFLFGKIRHLLRGQIIIATPQALFSKNL